MRTKKCPVCGWEIKDKGIPVKAGNRDITVCCDDCARKAKENPERYSAAGQYLVRRSFRAAGCKGAVP